MAAMNSKTRDRNCEKYKKQRPPKSAILNMLFSGLGFLRFSQFGFKAG